MPSPLPSAYVGRDLNPQAVSVRLEYASGEGMDLAPGDGNLAISAIGLGRQTLPVKDRGTFDGFTPGEYTPQELSITVRQLNQTLVATDVARLESFFSKTGFFASATDDSDTPGTFRVIVTYADKSTKTFSACEGELSEAHAFPSNTYGVAIRSHGGCVVANI